MLRRVRLRSVEPAAHSVSVRWAPSDSVAWRDIAEKGAGLATVGESALSGGCRATVCTRPVGVIDVAVFVVASVRATDTLVFVVLGGNALSEPSSIAFSTAAMCLQKAFRWT